MNIFEHKPLLAFIVVCIVIMLLPQHVCELLYLHIEHVKDGEYWRVFSAHFTHYSWIHCLSNIVGLFLLIGIFSHNQQRIRLLLAATVICIAISSGLILFSTQLDWYLGFSGVLIGLFAYASIKTSNENTVISTIILIVLSTYVVIKLFEGELISSITLANLKASSYAHAYGFVAGVLFAITDLFIISKYLDRYSK
jgi:rhomboid family GlyGly-CTERM serine protease|tara:strand:- start:208 stop:795 length:588 start_codon:yes stop_codon:yes gene_type:complete